MTHPPRRLLGQLSALLATLAWAISLAFLGLSSTALQALGAEIPIGQDTLSAGRTPLELGVSMQMMNGAMEGWALAIGAFGVFAAGAIAALLSVESGRRALRYDHASASAAAGTTAGGLYLACLAALMCIGLPG